MVVRDVENLLDLLSEAEGFEDLIKGVLTRAHPTFPFKGMDIRQWSLLPSIVCESIGGHFAKASPACAAIQLLIAAGEIFDDIEDVDSSESLSVRYGTAVAINVATTLLILAEKAITQLKEKGVADHIIVRVMDTVNLYYTKACAGQHLDLTLTPEIANSEDVYFRVANMKSASTPECACCIGALLATENQELIDKFSLFGQNLGIASQIANDILGITCGSDIVKRKMSLPVIYTLNQTDGDVRSQVESVYKNTHESSPDPKHIKDLLFSNGAVYYSIIKMNLYKQRALDILSEVEIKGTDVKKLKSFLD